MIDNKRCHRLKSLSVVGGFLDGMNIEFADGLNCLIGHRGTGKTTVLEFIRYALDEFPRDDGGQARKRVEALVRSNLGDGRIRLAVQTRDGLEYIVDRSASGEPMVLTADGQPTDVRINVAGIFSADIFSQNEVENIADSPQSQLELIDRFAAAEIAEINRKVADLRSKLDANTNAIVTHTQQFSGLANEVSELEVINAKIKTLAEDESAQADGEINLAQQHRAQRGREEQALKEAGELIRKYMQWLHDAAGRFIQDIEPAFDEGMFSGPNGMLMGRIHETLKRIGGKLDRLFDQAAAEIDSGARDLEDLGRQLKEAHQQQELTFRELIARHNHARGVATERAELEKKRNDILAKDRRKVELQRKLDQLYLERETVARQLRNLWDQRFAIRQRVANWISERANSSIRVRIDQCGDRSDYTQALVGWLKGFVGHYNPVAKKIADYIPPAELLRIVREGRINDLQSQADLSDTQASKALESLRRLEIQLQLDAIELADLPRIELLEGEQWRNSLELSTGQKCTTILPILLLESHNPLLVDQPEDNLDNRYIYDTVVNAIHRVKQNRQIILITHNPNIPVLGEASAVYVLTSDGERARLANQGSVDNCKTEIINLLEGGKEAFIRRKDRYNY
ncbi:MAG TPA: AAA family ATPase [Phycisphaerae bacterium]|nr:AAA family ATPase [Phycisphaerae bacterium]HPP29252.1 AAA family ATPase [Phycisphaerae bacterium]HPU31089.1 AAA family ATPase [Phycisphaerae bacterium]